MHHNKAGFTLLELLIALFIFSLVAMIITGGLHTVFTAQASREKKATQLAELQIALSLLSRDVEQVIDRPITKSNGSTANAFVGRNDFAEFTHNGWANPLAEQLRCTEQRTAYFLEKNQLIRESWTALDQTAQTPSRKRILLTDISQFQLQYLDKENKFHSTWPSMTQTKSNEELPRAIRIFILFKDGGKITQLIVTPGTKLEKTP